ncbi:sugar ABC transporter permease [Paenibacillus marchantiophytorum]|uniref:Sugar ABC transporter permease n=1 Tax=Paenibacillus marchantiophytorum TaxID=1619310 RepID=A0ABQ1FET7_9BACL|nr:MULTISPECIES: ABC transporter permease subunit [Paenibacillus]UKS27060.1 ABC transporter permease subunit [Paenibacillus sp. HWE-109]GGA09615.1 sugar ABC transporter permease [Paenibacillus marchantiophytorum]
MSKSISAAAASSSHNLIGRKPPFARMTRRLLLYAVSIFFIFGPLSSLILWSLAEKWFWPHPFPSAWGFKYWHQVFEGKMLSSLGLSFAIAITVTLLCLVLTVPLSYLIARNRLPFKHVILLLFLLPQAFPQLPVFTNAMVFLYRFDLVGTLTGLTLIHLVGAIVFSVWTLVSVFQSVAESMEEASYMLGGGKVYTFFHVVLPMAAPGIIASSLLVFLYSLDEFTGSLLIGAPFHITMPVFMYNAANGYEMQVASVTSVLLMVPGIILLFFLQRFMRSEYLAAFGRV